MLCNFIEITLWHGCSPVNLLNNFRTPFPENTSRGLLLTKSGKIHPNDGKISAATLQNLPEMIALLDIDPVALISLYCSWIKQSAFWLRANLKLVVLNLCQKIKSSGESFSHEYILIWLVRAIIFSCYVYIFYVVDFDLPENLQL